MERILAKVKEGIIGRTVELESIVLALSAGKHILLEGPPGTSKSTMLRKVAIEMDLPFYMIEGSIDLVPGKLTGHFDPSKVLAGDFKKEFFIKGPLTKAMEEGGIFYIEEFNRMPADVSNVLISPMEEGELHIPRYGTVKAAKGFTIIAAQNPFDDVGTVRVSRAFMDRICRIAIGYQSIDEEEEIVRYHTDCPEQDLISFAVQIVRETRKHQEFKLGASVRAAIDLVDMAKQFPLPINREKFTQIMLMALSGKAWLNELSERTAEDLLKEIQAKVLNTLPQKTFISTSKETEEDIVKKNSRS
ncbi:MAG: MoxR family ATPase [Clostridia bacterium]|nr:MoxR family ATPase [Clostridia bacterium]